MPEVDDFIRAAKLQGASDEFLVQLLRQRGWPERAVYDALGKLYAESTGLPLPEPKSNLESAREAFYHLLAFGTLSVWICAIGYIWFELIDVWVPDETQRRYYSWGLRQVSWQIAAILVSFPVFVFATRNILADMAANPEKVASPVRRWLTNIALLIAALIFVGDLIAFLAVFLQGELSARFLSKSLVVLLLSGGVFLYYTRGIGARDATPARSWHRRFAYTAGILILLTLAFGFWRTGGPAAQRQLAEDRRRTEDFSTLSTAIRSHYDSNNKTLPKELAELNNASPTSDFPLADPFTQQPYEYTPLDGPNYRLCATFSHASESDTRFTDRSWKHPAGKHCYTLSATKFYPYPSY